ncbi:MAG: Na+:solute symporter [Gemmatimonadetes bacterium]|nr:Na+:solute symporter [Gemmatimonadota bacterium]
MALAPLDWAVLALYFVLSLAIGLHYTRRASASTAEFFVSGRNLPWWLAGTSMVATSFAVDTPLVVTAWVRTGGIQENWIWWCLAMSGMLAVFVFAKLWRRSEVVTVAEFTELRYAGRSASALRGFRAVYLTLYANALTMGWLSLAMLKVLGEVLSVGKEWALVVTVLVTLLYGMLGGLWGAVVTDLFQFSLAMVGSVLLAIFAVDAAGGIANVLAVVGNPPVGASAGRDVVSFLPPLEAGGDFWSTPLATFLMLVTVQWWSNKNSDGGPVVVQRIAASRDEREALLATLWFQVANYALRPWPWILTALASLVLYPDLADPEIAYPRMMVDLLPAGLRGVMLASLTAAFMSSFVTFINLSAAYLVNDLYRRFLVRGASERHYVAASRVASVVAVVLGGTVGYFATSISGLFKLLLELGAGVGLVYIARWFWWRVNAWSEIAAMLTSSIFTAVLRMSHTWGGPEFTFPQVVLLNAAGSFLVWWAVTLLTAPTPMPKLIEFYRKVRPPGWWGPVRSALPEGSAEAAGLGRSLVLWAISTVFVYAALFGTGKLLLRAWVPGALLSAVALATGAYLWRNLSREKVAALLR